MRHECRVLQTSNPVKYPLGKLLTVSGMFPSVAPYFQYAGSFWESERYQDSIEVHGTVPKASFLPGLDPTWIDERLMIQFLHELAMDVKLKDQVMSVVYATEERRIRTADLLENDEWMEHYGGQLDFFRHRYEGPLQELYDRNVQAIRTLRGLPYDPDLREAYQVYEETPHLLCLSTVARDQLGLHGPISGPQYQRVLRERRQQIPGVQTPLRQWLETLWKMREIRFDKWKNKETAFLYPLVRGPLNRTLFRNYPDAVPRAIDWLVDRGEIIPFPSPPAGIYAFPPDLRRATFVDSQLQKLFQRGIQHPPSIRKNGRVPCLPRFDLTGEQQGIARHMIHNPLTLVLGAPGTGKSELIVWAASHFRHVVVVTFVGMMVDAIQRRLNNHRELANTIHYVYYMDKNSRKEEDPDNPLRKWLRQFEVVVLDEGSNVDIALMAKFFRCFPRMSRLLIVGDLEQIPPIDAGSPFGDMTRAFPNHCFRLTQVLRTKPHARLLADACRHISNATSPQIEWGDAVRLITPQSKKERDRLICQEFARVVRRPEDLLRIQCITLKNATCRECNGMIEEYLRGAKVFPRSRKVPLAHKLNGNCKFFVGKKIMFLENTKPYKDPISGAIRYGGVRNGELALVKSYRLIPGTTTLLVTLHDGKTVAIDKREGMVQPHTVMAGYVTTSNKSQGSEWDHTICIFPPGCGTQSGFWNRSHPYVAISRAKESCMILGDPLDFHAMCARPVPFRQTLLVRLLQQWGSTKVAIRGLPLEINRKRKALHVFGPEEELACKEVKDFALALLAKGEGKGNETTTWDKLRVW